MTSSPPLPPTSPFARPPAMPRRTVAMQWAADLKHKATRLAKEELAAEEAKRKEAKQKAKSRKPTKGETKSRRRTKKTTALKKEKSRPPRRQSAAASTYGRKLGPEAAERIARRIKHIYPRLVDEHAADLISKVSLGHGEYEDAALPLHTGRTAARRSADQEMDDMMSSLSINRKGRRGGASRRRVSKRRRKHRKRTRKRRRR